MEDLEKIFERVEQYEVKLESMKESFLRKIRSILQEPNVANGGSMVLCSSPSAQQTKKRKKRLVKLEEETRSSTEEWIDSADRSQDQVVSKASTEIVEECKNNDVGNEAIDKVAEHQFLRPQRAAKLKGIKNLKESFNAKLHRQNDSGNLSNIVIKQELVDDSIKSRSSTSIIRTRSSGLNTNRGTVQNIAVASVVGTDVEEQNTSKKKTASEEKRSGSLNSESDARQLRVVIKREKVSITEMQTKTQQTPRTNQVLENRQDNQPSVNTAAKEVDNEMPADGTAAVACPVVPNIGRKGKNKKDAMPKPIKVERFSDVMKHSSEKTSGGRQTKTAQNEESTYEDANEDLPTSEANQNAMIAPQQTCTFVNGKKIIETAAPIASSSDATFITNQHECEEHTFVVATNANGTKPVDDVTFNVNAQNAGQRLSSRSASMVTAKDAPSVNSSLITEDESICYPEVNLPPPSKPAVPAKLKSAKVLRAAARVNELFNPLVQSPLKKKVEAFEKAAVEVAKHKQNKNTALPIMKATKTTPVIGKLPPTTLGRFLTPTQQSNIKANDITKKVTRSASKAPNILKTASSIVKPMSAKALSRDGSHEDLRRHVVQNSVEEKRKQREQKHLQAAQQREAIERERAERLQKAAKEHKERLLKVQQGREEKKKLLEDLQMKLKHTVVHTSIKAKPMLEMEREYEPSLQQMGPPPRVQSLKVRTKYTFDMLHEEDSTDDEGKITYKRPPPPSWSLSHLRGPAILLQQSLGTAVFDSFFSVQPLTPDMKQIFPDIDDRHLRRNSSAIWNTPPRYSELPKY